jgi:hypothetical protein
VVLSDGQTRSAYDWVFTGLSSRAAIVSLPFGMSCYKPFSGHGRKLARFATRAVSQFPLPDTSYDEVFP